MPINKLALVRYKTIDQCLQNRFCKWTLEDLMEACSDALYEYEGITTGVSRRTVQLDLQNMRSEKLGYNAPIVVLDKKFYSYEKKDYSITNIPLTRQDMQTLNEVVGILRQFKGFGYFQEINSMVTRLEDKLYKQQHKGQSFIEFEKNDLLKGLRFIDPLHRYIQEKKVIEIEYQSFKARREQFIQFHPYLLKEYRNRWFLLGFNPTSKSEQILALDRIVHLKELHEVSWLKPEFAVHQYFEDVIGVSKVPKQKAQKMLMKIDPASAPYILTKPLHPTQTILKQDSTGTIFSIEVIWNFELEREILGFGEQLQVLSPKRLAGKIIARLKATLGKYQKPVELVPTDSL